MNIRLILSVLTFCLFPSFMMAQSEEGHAGKKEKSSEPVYKLNGDTMRWADDLLGDNIKINSLKKKKELNKAIEDAILKELTAKEDLDAPAFDLYGAASWNSGSVNPIGNNTAAIPDEYDIDCSQFTPPLDNDMRVTSHYGYRRRFHRMHYGTDLKLQIGDTIRAAFDGKVRVVDYERRGYGHYVVIRHPNGMETVYGHMSRTIAKPNQIVHAGEPIGLGGNTGRSTGPHLHFEMRFMGIALNPESIINFSTGIPKSGVYAFHKSKSVRGRTYAANKSGTKRDFTIYRIRKGDTLSTIAARFGTSVAHICRMNGISTRTTLRIGKPLRL